MNPSLENILRRVAKPGQYVGGEPNAESVPDARLRVALAFPDLYEIGMSNHGLRVLRDVANRVPGVAAERAFAPLPDMEAELRRANLPLSTLETGTPLNRCDVVGVSLSYELSAAAMLTILNLGGIPLLREERHGGPFVIAGGHAAMNPEPWADFVDLLFIGEAEESLPEFLRLLMDAGTTAHRDRDGFLAEAARIVPGVYAPGLYRTAPNASGFLYVAEPLRAGLPFPVRRRVVEDFDTAPHPSRPVVPIPETAHERAVVEILRGCPNGCRFCQAGFITRPVRARKTDTILRLAEETLAATGYDEVTLLGLSVSDHPQLEEVLTALDCRFAAKGIGISLPSLRVDGRLASLPERLQSVRKSALTAAPEAGTERLRAAIRKNVRDNDLLAACDAAYRNGWASVKLYFMVGLPTETDEDLDAIARLADRAARLRRSGKGQRKAAVSLSLANFVPKAHTPFQWEGAAGIDAWRAKQRRVRDALDRRRVEAHGHDPETSLWEAVLARADRRVGRAILGAWERGARLDGWTEHFRAERWRDAFAAAGLDPDVYACRQRSIDDPQPWEHIEGGVTREFLLAERERSLSPSPLAGEGGGEG